jgi:hypothetical protein
VGHSIRGRSDWIHCMWFFGNAEMNDEEIEVFILMGDNIPTSLDSDLLFYTIDLWSTIPTAPHVQPVTDAACAAYARTRCWDDAACTSLMSAQLVSKDQCKAIGGMGWGPNSSDCTAL